MAVCQGVRERTQVQIRDVDEQIKRNIESDLWEEEAKALSNMKINQKYFYPYAKRKSASRTSVATLRSGADTVSDPEVVSDVLQEQYVKSFSCPGAISVVPCRNERDI